MTRFAGVYAALLAPRHAAGDLDVASFVGQLHTAAADKLAGYAINGATGEFPFATVDELRICVTAAREAAPGKQILAGIGAGDLRGALQRASVAADAGADAVLLPMPSFFPYRQDDLRAFSLSVADRVQLPVLLYNLPQFTSGLHVDTVLQLVSEHSNIAGVKDSSGSLDIVRALTQANVDAARIIGNDSALCAALREGVCDGVVSGVACTLPELMTEIFAHQPSAGPFAQKQMLLEEFIEHLGALPTPWGLKVTSAVRGFTSESYPFPLSAERAAETAELRAWFTAWLPKAIAPEVGAS